jgi:exonuclease III
MRFDQLKFFALVYLTLGSVTANADVLSSEATHTYQDMFKVYENSKFKIAEKNTLALKVVTLNFGFLWEWIRVPEYPRRSRELIHQLKKFLNQEKPDIFFCQEVWYANDLDNFYLAIDEVKQATGGELAYVPAYEKSRREEIEKKGIFFFVKKSILSQTVPFEEAQFEDYRAEDGSYVLYTLERSAWKKPYRRGFLSTTLTLTSGVRVLVGTTHLTPVITYAGTDPGQIEVRNAQSKLLGAMILKKKDKVEYAIVGGDWNAAIEHGPSPTHEEVYRANEQPYVSFFETTQMIDSFRVANPDTLGFTWSPSTNSVTLAGPLKTPEQRIDFIWIRSFNEELKLSVKNSMLVFDAGLRSTEPPFDFLSMTVPAAQAAKNGFEPSHLFMSDHYGVASTVEISNRQIEIANQTLKAPISTPFGN